MKLCSVSAMCQPESSFVKMFILERIQWRICRCNFSIRSLRIFSFVQPLSYFVTKMLHLFIHNLDFFCFCWIYKCLQITNLDSLCENHFDDTTCHIWTCLLWFYIWRVFTALYFTNTNRWDGCMFVYNVQSGKVVWEFILHIFMLYIV